MGLIQGWLNIVEGSAMPRSVASWRKMSGGGKRQREKPAPHAAYLYHVASMAPAQHFAAPPCARVVRRKLSSTSAT